MGLIRLDKTYDNLYVFGCSITTGHKLNAKGSWGTYLANKLNCNCVIRGLDSSSNSHIINEVIDVCETFDMSNSCVGIQFSERNRRDFWSNSKNQYTTFNLSTIMVNKEESLSSELKFIKKILIFSKICGLMIMKIY